MAPKETPKATSKVQLKIIKTTRAKASPMASIKKTVTSAKTPEKNRKVTNTTLQCRTRTKSVPKMLTPKPKEQKATQLPGNVTKSDKKASWNRRPKPAHSGVPVPEKMKKLLEKELKDADCSLGVPYIVTNTTLQCRTRTKSVPKMLTPKPKEQKVTQLPGNVTKSDKKASWNRRPKPAHSGVPVPEKMKKLLEKELKDADCSLGVPYIVTNTTLQCRTRTKSAPKMSTPKLKEQKVTQLPGNVTKSDKKASWNRRPKPAHSGVPVPEKMKKLLEKDLKDADCSLGVSYTGMQQKQKMFSIAFSNMFF